MIFQDFCASLNPRWIVEDIVGEPLKGQGIINDKQEPRAKVNSFLKSVGLSPLDQPKHPHQFSGGQRQRISIGGDWPSASSRMLLGAVPKMHATGKSRARYKARYKAR